MISILFLTLSLLLIEMTVFADPFSDVPSDHWACDSVQMLEEKGLVEGYPDGLFKGDRPMTRYEMAMVVARVMAKLEQLEASIPESPDLSIYATKEDLEVLNRLIKEFQTELEALGVRVTNIEDSLVKLDSRVEELERVFISGDITVVANSLGYTQEPFEAGSVRPPVVFEEYAQFGLFGGADVSARLNLDVGVNISENVMAGGTLTAYSHFGDPEVTFYWGNLPGYSQQGVSEANLLNNGVNFQTNLNKLWFKTGGDLDVTGTFGEYQPEMVSPLIYYGVVGPSYWSPDSVPVNGIDIYGKLYGNFKFEVFQADDITWIDGGPGYVFPAIDRITGQEINNPYNLFDSDYYQNQDGYHSRMYGALFGYETERFDCDVTYLRIYEDVASRPASPLSPKDEMMLDFRAGYMIIEDNLKITGEFAQSWFDFDLRDSFARETGNAFIMGAEGTFSNFFYEAKFLRIEGNYEPFNFRKIFTNTDEGAYIMSYYIPNRIGFYGRGGYEFDEGRGRIDGGIGYFRQIDATLDTVPETTIGSRYGFQDHSFVNNSAEKGRELHFDIGGYYDIRDDFTFEARFLSINFNRNYPDALTPYTHEQTRNFLHLAGIYDITENLSVMGRYRLATVKGIADDGADTEITLHIPGVSLAYEFSEDFSTGIDYEYYNHNDSFNAGNDYGVNRMQVWSTLSF